LFSQDGAEQAKGVRGAAHPDEGEDGGAIEAASRHFVIRFEMW
jgi:hypothetical protein